MGTFLYYGIAVDNTILMALNALAVQQNRATKKTATEVTQFLNYCATNPDATVTFEASDMILHVHSDASYLSEPNGKSRAGGYHFLGPKPTSKTPMPAANGPVHVVCKILKNVMASSMEAELGGLFLNGQEAVYLRTILNELGHPQPPTPMVTDNSAANSIVNDIGKQKRSRAIDMRFYWVKDRIKQGQFNVYWKPGQQNLADYYTKHFPASHHRNMRPIVLTDKTKTTSLYGKQQHTRGCVDTTMRPGSAKQILTYAAAVIAKATQPTNT